MLISRGGQGAGVGADKEPVCVRPVNRTAKRLTDTLLL